MILALFSLFFGSLLALLGANFSGAQSKASDVERKTDINGIHAKLEEYFNENGSYPLASDVESRGSVLFPGIDGEAFIDPNNNRVNEGGYTYSPSECSIIGCAKYTLSTELEDQSTYTKNSLN